MSTSVASAAGSSSQLDGDRLGPQRIGDERGRRVVGPHLGAFRSFKPLAGLAEYRLWGGHGTVYSSLMPCAASVLASAGRGIVQALGFGIAGRKEGDGVHAEKSAPHWRHSTG